MRKTAKMLELEQTRQCPIQEVIRTALEQTYSTEGAAKNLGVTRMTLEMWMAKMQIRTRRVVVVGSGHRG